jgi:hypothetical protein
LLHSIEGADYLENSDAIPIIKEIPRIIARQFPWQRRDWLPDLYRSVYIFGQGLGAKFFNETHGLTINEFTLFGFALFVSFGEQPIFRADTNSSEIGFDAAKTELALRRLCLPIDRAQKLTRDQRQLDISTAYQPSLLRSFPCISFGPKRRRVYAPLPQLILDRITTGLYYDVVDGGQKVREEYGRRFEKYAFAYLNAMLPNLNICSEWSYKFRKQRFDTPDIICMNCDNEVSVIIECKAHRMSHIARFGESAAGEAGYQSMAKAILQIWRFVSHSRSGGTGKTTAIKVVGMVLTLDDWLVGDTATDVLP